MFNSAVIIRDDSSANYLNMWGGFSYSFDHFNRDGACFSTKTGEIYDIISLLASGAYRDTSSNIGTTDDIELMANTHR